MRITFCCMMLGLILLTTPRAVNSSVEDKPLDVSFCELITAVNSSVEDKPLDVSFCELITAPHNYFSKEVRVKAIHRLGFEWSELYSLKCQTDKSVWIVGEKKYCHDSAPVKEYMDKEFSGRTIGLVAVGRLYGEGGYGHFGAYEYKFEIKCIEKAKVLLKGASMIPQALSEKQRSKIERWETSDK